MDKNVFFRKATLLLCSSLDIEVALGRCREFLGLYIPADEITLNIYDPDAAVVRYLARAGQAGCEKIEAEVKLSTGLVKSIETGQRFEEYLIINDLTEDAMGKRIKNTLGLDDASIIALRLVIEGYIIGVADLIAYGKGRFTAEHAKLFSLLKEPFSIAMANALKHQETVRTKDLLASDNRYLHKKLFTPSAGEVIGNDGGLKYTMMMVNQVAPLNNTILLLGETGVGKEVIANAIHLSSPRRKGPFIKVNCGAIPETLIDSELFGHEKGAFTGAVRQKRGLFERADRGTIFLDEIGELPLQAQVRLLRVLQTHEIERVGGSPPIPLDIRVIVATHQNLEIMVEEGRFREDLWFRINVFPIQIPPLRQRTEDIPALVHYFMMRKSEELGLRPPSPFSSEQIAPLLEYDWPGNVRELENLVERTLIQQRSGPLIAARHTQQHRADLKTIHLEGGIKPMPLDDIISSHIRSVLDMTDGKINGPDGAAALLHVHPNTLRNRMNKLGIPYGRSYRRTE